MRLREHELASAVVCSGHTSKLARRDIATLATPSLGQLVFGTSGRPQCLEEKLARLKWD